MTEFRPPLSWRVRPAEDMYGWWVYFDASTEVVGIRGLTLPEKIARLDKLGSVSAVEPDEIPEEVDATRPVESLTQQSFRQLKLFTNRGV